MNKLIQFVQMGRKLNHYFTTVYQKNLYEIDSIDQKNGVFNYRNTRSGEIFAKQISELLTDKNFLKNFDNKDATYLGYIYGIWLQQH